jgi:hypothetical protein
VCTPRFLEFGASGDTLIGAFTNTVRDRTRSESGQGFRNVHHKDRCGQQLEAACRLVTHELGWELRLDVAGSLQRSQGEVLMTGRSAMMRMDSQ